MAKKQKKNLQRLIAKRQQLQQVNQDVSASSALPSSVASGHILPAPANLPALPADTHLFKEVRRTVISFVIIAAFLVVAVMIDRQTSHLRTLGDQLYTFLRLNR